MKEKVFLYIFVGVFAVNIALYILRVDTSIVYPLATWDLFSNVAKQDKKIFVYLKSKKSGDTRYFYAYPELRRDFVLPNQAFHLARRLAEARDAEVYERRYRVLKDYIFSCVKETEYELILSDERTTYHQKWKELRHEFERP